MTIMSSSVHAAPLSPTDPCSKILDHSCNDLINFFAHFVVFKYFLLK